MFLTKRRKAVQNFPILFFPLKKKKKRTSQKMDEQGLDSMGHL